MQKHMPKLGGALMVVVIAAEMGILVPPAVAQKAMVPQTGQVGCWDTRGMATNCPSTGQDGALQAGVPLPTPRLKDNGDGTVTDRLTGLIWLKDVECFSIGVPWVQALRNANTLMSGGGNCHLTDGSRPGDWRVPNIRELLSVINFGFADPALGNTAGTGHWASGSPFVGDLTSLLVWTSTSRQGSPTEAWIVYTNEGFTNVFPKADETNVRVWLVRGGK